MQGVRREVRRDDDGELCGFVAADGDRWQALTVFGGVLGEYEDDDVAVRHTLNDGLASVADRWMLSDAESGEEQIVCIQQMSPDEVTLALDYYSLPGVPTLTIATSDLAPGARWQLRRC